MARRGCAIQWVPCDRCDKWPALTSAAGGRRPPPCEHDTSLVGGCDVPEELQRGKRAPDGLRSCRSSAPRGSRRSPPTASEVGVEEPHGHRPLTLERARKAAAAYRDPASLVGQVRRVWWPREKTWFEADVGEFDAETAKHIMVYRADLIAC